MTLTTSEVADMLRVSESRVRQLVMAGDLDPLVRGARPLTFDEAAVVEYEHRTRRNADQIRQLAASWRGSLANDERTC